MGHIKRVRYRTVRRQNVGEHPGAIVIADDAVKPIITVYSYNAHELVCADGHDLKVILDQFKKCTDHTHWIQIRGLNDQKLIEDIGTYLKVNPLVLEDIANTHQRPKFDEYDDYVFTVTRQIYFNADGELCNNQFSTIVKAGLIISFEETHDEHFEGVKARLKGGKGAIRTAGPGYMAYALNDTIIDTYFVLLARIGDELDSVEDRVYSHADKTIMYDAQQLKRTLIILRRITWPERDKINDILRSDNALISDEVKTYLKDAYDHTIQVMDLIENYKEIASSIIDLYLSLVSNRMNEIMKVLTIISVIFIPLTFIAGVYGMNFARVDPATNKVFPANMPELYSPHGYVYALSGMVLIGIIQVFVFWKKGWFTKL